MNTAIEYIFKNYSERSIEIKIGKDNNEKEHRVYKEDITIFANGSLGNLTLTTCIGTAGIRRNYLGYFEEAEDEYDIIETFEWIVDKFVNDIVEEREEEYKNYKGYMVPTEFCQDLYDFDMEIGTLEWI